MKYIIYPLFFIAGITGLVYQIVWSKYFLLFIGATSYAHAITLSTFMGGLALGNYIFGHIADRKIKKLKLYSFLELGIGASCLLFPMFFEVLSNLYLKVATGGMPGSFGVIFFKCILSIFSILLPTTLMGGTLPVMSKFFIKSIKHVGSGVGFLYFLNTAGAILGCIIGGFFIIHTLGIEFSIQAFSIINITIGAITFFLSKYEISQIEERDVSKPYHLREEVPPYTPLQRKAVLIAIAISGFASFLYELVWTRLLSLIIGSATQSFSIMLLTFITGITVGSYIAGRLFKKDRDAVKMLAIVELLICATILLVFPLYDRLPYYFNRLSNLIPRVEHFFVFYQSIQILVCFTVMFLPTIFIGMSLPIASHVNVESLKILGRGVGNTFSFNTFGTLMGSFITGFFLIPILGLEQSLEVGIILNFLIGCFLLFTLKKGRRVYISGCAIPAFILLIFFILYFQFDKNILQVGIYRNRAVLAKSFSDFKKRFENLELLYYKDGSSVTVSVTKSEKGKIFLQVNGKTDAGTGADMPTQLILGHLPMILHKNPQDVFILGLGSGITTGAVSMHKELKLCETAEISKEVVEALKFFEPYNNRILKNPKVKILNVDAREYLKLNPQRKYDVMISEPSNPWMAGVGNLFTKEFFQEMSSHLKPGGIVVQWVHIYESNDRILSMILNTFGSVFKYVTVWSVFTMNDILLVGSQSPILPDIQRIVNKFKDKNVFEDLSREGINIKINDAFTLLSMQILSDFRFRLFFPSSQFSLINEDKFPILEYVAPVAFFAGTFSRILSQIDERKIPSFRSFLFLKDYLYENPIIPEKAIKILSSLSIRAGVLDENVVLSFIYYLYNNMPINSIKNFIKYFDNATIGSDLIYSRIINSENFSKQDCENYLNFKKNLLARKSSIWYRGDIKEIEVKYEECIEKFPDSAFEFNKIMADLYKVVGESEKQILILRELLKNSTLSSSEIFIFKKELAKAFFLEKKFNLAKEIFEELVKLKPEDFENRFYLKRINYNFSG